MLDQSAEAVLFPFPGRDDEVDNALAALGLTPARVGSVDPDLRDPLIYLPVGCAASLAEETLWSRGTDLRGFVLWCRERGIQPLAERQVLTRHLLTYLTAASATLKPASLERAGSSLVAFTKGLGLPNTLVEERRKMVVRASNRSARERKTDSVEPVRLTRPEIEGLVSAIRNSSASETKRARDLALVHGMSELMLRRSEVRNFRFCDWNPAERELTICHSKTDQKGQGAIYVLSEVASEAMEAWLTISGLAAIDDPDDLARTPIFPGLHRGGTLRVNRSGKVVPLTGKSISRILSGYAEEAGLSGVSGHTLRRSVARLLFDEGVDDDEIAEAGR